MEKTVNFRVKLIGNDDTVKKLEKLVNPIAEVGNLLDAIGKKKKELDNLVKQFKTLTSELKKVQTALKGTSSKKLEKEQEKFNEEIGKTNRTLAQVRKELKALEDKGGDTYKELIKEAAKLRAEQTKLNKDIRDQQKAFEQVEGAAGSYRQLNAELVTLRNTYKELSKEEREGATGKKALKRIQELDKELKTIDKKLGQYFRNVGNYISSWDGLTTVITRVTSLIGVSAGLEEIIQTNSEISDSIADVAKTVDGATIPAIQRLSDALENRDTRTSLVDLLGIGEIGGRLGVAEEDLEKFIGAIDTAFVALGDQFGTAEAVTDTLAKIRNNLADTNNGDENLADDLLKIGNALNVLETQGPATAKGIADFVNRLSGLSGPLNITSGQLFGLSTTLSELGESPERASTAVQKLLLEIANTPERFASLVGKSTEDFEKLVNENIVEALALVSQAATESTESSTDFVELLNELGLEGGKSISVFSKLGGAYGTLSERIGTANDALLSQDSLLEEFDKKNNNLAASIEKLKNQIIALTVGSGIQDFLQVGVQGITSLVSTLRVLPAVVKENREAFVLLGVALVAFNFNAIKAQANIIRLATVQKAAAVQARTFAAVQGLVNAALAANPIGLVVGAIALLAAGFITLYKNVEPVRNAVNDLSERFNAIYEDSLLLKTAFFFIIEPIKLIYGLFTGAPNAVNQFLGALELFRIQAVEKFKQVGLQAQKLGLQFKQTLSFGVGGSNIEEDLQEIENQIKASNDRIQLQKDKNTLLEARFNKQVLTEQIQEEKKAAKERENIIDGEDIKRQRISEKEKARIKELAKVRAEAAKRIVDLENAAISNEFDRDSAQATTSANREISGLTGDASQIDRQTELILQRLDKQLEEIEKRRDEAQKSALDDFNNFNRELANLQASSELAVFDTGENAINNLFDLDTANVSLNFKQQEALLKDSLDKRLITQEDFNDRLKAISIQRDFDLLEAEKQRNVALLEIQQAQVDARIKLLEEQKENEILSIQEAAEERRRVIEQQQEDGLLTDPQFSAAQLSLEESLRLQKLEAERNFQSEKSAIIQEVALENIKLQEDIASKELDIANEKNERIKAAELRRVEAARAVSDAQIGLLSTFVSETRSLLSRDEENRKKYGAVLKGLALAEIAINLQRQLQNIALGISKDTARLGVIGTAISTTAGAIQTAAAITRAAFAAAQVLKQEFKEGGAIGEGSSDSMVTMTGSGSVPKNEGTILAQSHDANGVTVLKGNQPLEFEGDEHKLVNGPETYIINKKSARLFKGDLNKLHGGTNRFSPYKKAMASAINSYRGYGKKFQFGGVIGNSRIPSRQLLQSNPLAAPISFIGAGNERAMSAQVAEQNAMIIEMVRTLDEKTDAINERIDNIRVINDPSETVALGAEQIVVNNQRTL